MTDTALPDFDEPQLARAVERLSQADIDRLPFGAIRLDAEGRVTFYSAAERRLSGYRDVTLGRAFFAEIAPCMDHPDFRGRIESDHRAGRLDLEFGWIGDFSDQHRELRVRVQSATDGGIWVFMRRDT